MSVSAINQIKCYNISIVWAKEKKLHEVRCRCGFGKKKTSTARYPHDVAACDKNRMHGRYLIVPESTYGSCHMPLTPRRITHGGRVYEELSGDRNEVTHTSTCGPIALEIFFQALRPPRKSAPHGFSHDETDHCVRFYRRSGDINLSGMFERVISYRLALHLLSTRIQ